jgi:plexin A
MNGSLINSIFFAGKNFSDIYNGIKISGIDCVPYRELYIDTKQIVCKVEGPGVHEQRQGRIIVQISDYRGESKSDFEFVNPQIEDFEPKFGSISGGTVIRIKGKYLNAGSMIRAYINKLPCQILR